MIERSPVSPDGTHEIRTVNGWSAVWNRLTSTRLSEPTRMEDYVWLSCNNGLFYTDTDEKQACWIRWGPESKIVTIPFQSPLGNDGHMLVESPTQNLMAVGWWNQTESGVELIDFGNDELVHRAGKGLDFREDTNGISDPVFSSDGQRLAVGFTRFGWWVDWMESGLDPYEDSSPGGEFLAAWIIVGNTNDSTWSQPIEINVDVSEGWKPEEGEEDIFAHALISSMKFVDDQKLQIGLFKNGTTEIAFRQNLSHSLVFSS